MSSQFTKVVFSCLLSIVVFFLKNLMDVDLSSSLCMPPLHAKIFFPLPILSTRPNFFPYLHSLQFFFTPHSLQIYIMDILARYSDDCSSNTHGILVHIRVSSHPPNLMDVGWSSSFIHEIFLMIWIIYIKFL